MLRSLLLLVACLIIPGDLTAQTPDGFPLPAGAIHRFGNRQMRHPESVNAAAVSPDGKLLATMGGSSLVVWDLKTLNSKFAITAGWYGSYGFGDRSTNLKFYPDSKSLLVSVRPTDRTSISVNTSIELAQVWDMETGKMKFGLKGLWGFAFSSWLAKDGKEIALLSGYNEDTAIKYFDAATGKELRTVKTPVVNRGLWVSQNGKFVASPPFRANEGFIVANTETGEEWYRIASGRFLAAALSPDGTRLIHHTDDGKVSVHDLEARKELFRFDHPAANQRGPMRVSKDNSTLYFGGQSGQLFRWDLKNNKALPEIGRHSSWTLSAIALSPDESMLYSMGGDRLIRRWDLKAGKQLPLPDGYITQTAVVPAADGKNLIIADHVGAIDLWDLATGKLVKRLQAQGTGGIDCVAVSADGKWFAGGRTVQDVQLWDLQAGKLELLIPLVDKPDDKGGDHVKRVFFSPNAKVLFTGSGKTGITAWEVPTGKKLWNTPGMGQLGAVDPTGRWVAVAGALNAERADWTLLDAGTGQTIRRIEVIAEQAEDVTGVQYFPYIRDLKFSADGTRLLTAHHDGTVNVWDPDTGKLVGKLPNNGNNYISLACSPDGRLVAVGRPDKKISVWELATGKLVLTIAGHDSAVRDVAFTNDSRAIVGNADLSPVLWTLEPKDTTLGTLSANDQWDALTSDDGAKANRLVWALAKNPKSAVDLFHEHIKPAELAMERPQFDKWVAGLDHPQFRVREASEKSIAQGGLKVPAAWLRQALAATTSDEVRTRLTRLLTRREQPDPSEWRLGRAVQALELAGTPEAKALLRSWAGAGGSALAHDSRAALGRMGEKEGQKP